MPVRIDQPEQYRRPSLDDPAVAALVRACGVDPGSATDLGGTMSLNVRVGDGDGDGAGGSVLRVHPRFATRGRVRALRQVRRELAGAGATVGVPELLDGEDVVVVGDGCVAELERFVPQHKPPAEWRSYVWLFGAMGRLHGALSGIGVTLPRPVVATYGAPGSVRRWLTATRRAVADDAEAVAVAEWTGALLRRLHSSWVPARDLPTQLVHGDVRLGNVCVADADAESLEPAYFDFGFAALRPRVHDLAYSLPWIVLRPDGSGRPESFDWSSVEELVASYEEAARWTLTEVERRALGPYVAAVPLYLASVAAFTPDPVATIKGERPMLRIADWVLAQRPFG